MLWTEHRQSLRRGEEKNERGRKACPFYQYELKKIKPTRGPRFLSEVVSGPINKNSSKEISRRSIKACGTLQKRVHAYKLMC